MENDNSRFRIKDRTKEAAHSGGTSVLGIGMARTESIVPKILHGRATTTATSVLQRYEAAADPKQQTTRIVLVHQGKDKPARSFYYRALIVLFAVLCFSATSGWLGLILYGAIRLVSSAL
jgi:hypothetical protein